MLPLYYSKLPEQQHPVKNNANEMEKINLVISYQPAKLSQLQEIMAIEMNGFSPAEAATKIAMADRIKLYPDTFIAANIDDKVAGYVVGPATDQRYLTDNLFDQSHPNRPNDPYLAILSLVVHPDYRGQGIAGQLLSHLATVGKAQHRSAITLTCLKKLIPFYEQHGYINEGVSTSQHANEIWYNMICPLLS